MFKVTILILFSSFLASPDSEEIKVVIERNVPVPMRDGTILRADVHRPDKGGPYPVLVCRTPYGKYRDFTPFAKAGYIVVFQDARGRYESDGKWESLFRFQTHDAEDGYDTIEWAAKLPGSTGKVGTFGISYLAFLQWRLAPLRPPSLVAMSACSIPAQIGYIQNPCTIRPGFRLGWLANVATDMRRRENLPGVWSQWEYQQLWAEESQKWLYWLPWLELPDDFCGHETEFLKSWLKNPHLDPWKLDEGCKDISVPNLDIVGWYDHANGDMLLFQTMAKQASTEVARQGSRVIIGPWPHSRTGRQYGHIDFGPDAAIDKRALQIRWFDYWLKGIGNGVGEDAPVRIFVMGDNQWRDERNWPLKRTKDRSLYITSTGYANTPSGNGKLVRNEPEAPHTDGYTYDPKNPVPTPYQGRPIPADQRQLASRQDILVYQSEPMTERFEVTGNPAVELYASSSAPDTDWFVRLIDVAPTGLAVDVSMGLVRARYRNGFNNPKLLKPGEVVKYTIRMTPTSNAFLPGHRIRLDITSSDFPNFDRNHNTAANQNADATLAIAGQTIYHGGQQATRIILPWVPNPVEEKPEVKKHGMESRKQIPRLHQAVIDGDIPMVKLLLSEGADINVQDEEGTTPLCSAAEAGQGEIVQLLVEAGADVNAGEWTALHGAVSEKRRDMVELLIQKGAEVNTKDQWQHSPLYFAIKRGDLDTIKLLIAENADINAGEWTALYVYGAVSERRGDIVELLIQKSADVNTKDQWGQSPVYFAIQNGDLDTVKILIARGADIELKLPTGLTLLQYVASKDQPGIAELLLTKGVKVDEKDDVYEFTALHYAARFGSTKVAEILIAHGADIKAKDKWDYQPIHWAAYHDRPEIIELLIVKGADVNTKTSLGQTPLDFAIPRRNKASIEVLRKYSNDTNSDKPYVVLERGDIRAVIVNNEPVDDEVLPGHRGGYSGVASLTHQKRAKNLFVPFYAGLNFEHIHDGTNQPRDILFEPRRAPMQIKQIDEYTAELYQPPTPHWQLESRLRYQLLEDGAIEMSLECIPRARTFKNDYIGLFFASYINKPESLDIHFPGRPANDRNAKPRWIRGVTPAHGKLSTHLAVDDNRNFSHDPNFPLTLVFNKSNHRYTEPWYYGVSYGMAFVLMFRPSDNVRLSQSPSGGGEGNPAWDFQWFVPQYEVGQKYRFVMRAMYLPFESQQQIITATARHRAALKQ